jgi:prepilin-type N-terminal cleavage/methylation domain-containing protein
MNPQPPKRSFQKTGRGVERDSGFTLIELLLVFVILGILVTQVAASWPSRSITLQTQVDQLWSGLDLARSLAISRGESISIARLATGDGYSITDSWGEALYPDRYLNGASLDDFSLTFNGYGNPGSADTQIGLTLGETQMILQIVGESGGVRQL